MTDHGFDPIELILLRWKYGSEGQMMRDAADVVRDVVDTYESSRTKAPGPDTGKKRLPSGIFQTGPTDGAAVTVHPMDTLQRIGAEIKDLHPFITQVLFDRFGMSESEGFKRDIHKPAGAVRALLREATREPKPSDGYELGALKNLREWLDASPVAVANADIVEKLDRIIAGDY